MVIFFVLGIRRGVTDKQVAGWFLMKKGGITHWVLYGSDEGPECDQSDSSVGQWAKYSKSTVL